MFTMNYFILKPVDRYYRIKAWHIVISVILTLASVYVLNHLLFDILNLFATVAQGRGHKNEFDITNFFVSALVIGCTVFYRIVFLKQAMSVDYEKMKRESLQSQYEALKNQLSPHFLFNSLTALKMLISESPEKAQEYVNSLSRALRYTLQSNEKQLVTLEEEMGFMESYLFLIRMRFGSNLSVGVNIDGKVKTFLLPPLTLQTLVENAIKHNEVSRRRPLGIEIYTESNGTLKVCNAIQQKMTREEGTGIGLSNLSKQFIILTGKDISIERDENRFVVGIPLIKP